MHVADFAVVQIRYGIIEVAWDDTQSPGGGAPSRSPPMLCADRKSVSAIEPFAWLRRLLGGAISCVQIVLIFSAADWLLPCWLV
jgi:hypothetical protein